MLKKTMLLPLIFSTTALLADRPALICLKSTEEKAVAPVILEFKNPKLNTTKFDATSKKSAIEQYLDHGFNHAEIKTPYRAMLLLSVEQRYQREELSIEGHYPHRIEVPSEYAHKLHEALLKSDLLVAAVYRELFKENNDKASFIHDAGKYGFWDCMPSCNQCMQLTHKEIKELLDAFYETQSK